MGRGPQPPWEGGIRCLLSASGYFSALTRQLGALVRPQKNDTALRPGMHWKGGKVPLPPSRARYPRPHSPPLKHTVPVQVTWPRSASKRKVTRVNDSCIRVPFSVL